MSEAAPHQIVHVDLAEQLSGPLGDPHDHRDLFAIFWRQGRPLGHAQLTREETSHPASFADLVATAIAPAVSAHLLGEAFYAPTPELSPPPPSTPIDLEAALALDRPLATLDALPDWRASDADLSVIVCTRDRPELLERCLASITKSKQTGGELIVVDNAPSTDATRRIVENIPGARYVLESRPGLSAARNAGIRAARGSVLAFVDDDTVVHEDWLRRLLEAIETPGTMAVTGLVLPLELDTPAQAAFELLMGGFSRGYRRTVFDRGFVERTSSHGPPVWRIGAGANMAIRRRAFQEVGFFDERLGAGRAGCSEDSEFWYRLLAAGFECRYEPTAVVFHSHRRELPALYRQAHDYMQGHTAALFVQFARHRHSGNLRRAFAHLPRLYLGRAYHELRPSTPSLVRRRLAAEVTGYLRGLALAPLAVMPPPGGKRRLEPFLRRNPFPNPFTEGFFYREKMRAIHRVAPNAHPFDVLELGGGRSGLARLLYPDAQITNCDLDPALAGAPPNLEPQVRFVCADATKLPFDDASFDVVTMFDVLEHIEDDEAAAREALRVLRPGGWLLVTTPNSDWRFPFYRPFSSLCRTEAEMQAEWGHVRRGYAVDDLRALLGLEAERTATFISPITVICHDLGFSKLSSRVRRALCAVLSPVTWLGYELHRDDGPGTEIASSWRKQE